MTRVQLAKLRRLLSRTTARLRAGQRLPTTSLAWAELADALIEATTLIQRETERLMDAEQRRRT